MSGCCAHEAVKQANTGCCGLWHQSVRGRPGCTIRGPSCPGLVGTLISAIVMRSAIQIIREVRALQTTNSSDLVCGKN